MTKKVLLKTRAYTVWDDGTFWFSSWQKGSPCSLWRIVDGHFEFKHPQDENFRRASEGDHSVEDRWADKIMAILVEREIFGGN